MVPYRNLSWRIDRAIVWSTITRGISGIRWICTGEKPDKSTQMILNNTSYVMACFHATYLPQMDAKGMIVTRDANGNKKVTEELVWPIIVLYNRSSHETFTNANTCLLEFRHSFQVVQFSMQYH